MNMLKICSYIDLLYLNPYKIFSNVCARYNCLIESSRKLSSLEPMRSFKNPKCEDFESLKSELKDLCGCKKPACPPPCPPPKPKCPPPCPPKCPPPCPPKCPPPCPPPPKKCESSSKTDTCSTTNRKPNNYRRLKLIETQPDMSQTKSIYNKVKNRYTIQTTVEISELNFLTRKRDRQVKTSSRKYSKAKINTIFMNARCKRYYSTLLTRQHKRLFTKSCVLQKKDDEPCTCKLKPVEPDLLCILDVFRKVDDDEKTELGCYYECYKNKEYHMYTEYSYYDVLDYARKYHSPQPVHPKHGKKYP